MPKRSVLDAALFAWLCMAACRTGQESQSSPATPTAGPSATPATASPSAECFAGDVQTLRLPLYWDRQGSPSFDYKFQLKTSSRANAPVVIVIPGGPGGPSIGYAALAGGALPADATVLYTDPRGSNCNAAPGGHFPVDAYRTEYLARDVKAVVEKLQLRNFYVYGHSYGTVEGTVLTSILERESAYVPRGLVLEGTLGRHLAAGFPEQISAFDEQWQLVKEQLTPGVAEQFSGAALPLGFSSRQWARLITESLYEGVVPGLGIRLQVELDRLAAGDAATNAQLTAYFDQLDLGFRYLVDANVNAISCRELYGSLFASDLSAGHLVPTGNDGCQSLGVAFSDPYDSAFWPTTTPIYYFQGSNDPATPPSYAAYHLDTHRGSPRHFVYVLEASHDPLTQSLTTAGCSGGVWRSILFGTGTLQDAVRPCRGLDVRVSDSPAQ
ncbi:MAG TPA: alpha/beta hydrolase [Vicinamibacteria bacterium]|nr:alpha/beta hydrolase [Vicinamibacteria bacterium]